MLLLQEKTMIEALLLSAALFAFQDPPPPVTTSRPTSRATARRSDQERLLTADWGTDAPGEAVMPQKFLPIDDAPYTTPEKVSDRVRDKDLVIGLVVEGRAFAYPINMLGGPQAEIINDQFAGVPFCVNW